MPDTDNSKNLVKIDSKGAFQSLDNVVNKISNAIGWKFTRLGSKQDAVDFFVKSIKKRTDMPMLAQSAIISNSQKIIKEYSNQNDIVKIAIDNLANETAQPEKVDNDWLFLFFDKAKNISNKEMQLLWGKILSDEFKQPNTNPKTLIEILSVLSQENAL